MNDVELELAILKKYADHFDAVGSDVPKCERELDMRTVISNIIGNPVKDSLVLRWHSLLAPPNPYPRGLLLPCSDSTINKGPHRFHARAYIEPGKFSAWQRIAELESRLPLHESIKKEKEQKFGILYSINQAKKDFSSYSADLDRDSSVGILYLDIDNFKKHNTDFTESIVDKLILIPFQQLLFKACLYRGVSYRHGGEEFLILLPNHSEEEIRQFEVAPIWTGHLESGNKL